MRDGFDAERFAGEVITYNGTDFDIDDAMVDGVQKYLDVCRADVGLGDAYWIEQKFDLSDLHPGMFGTNDWCALKRDEKRLIVRDYKNGFGLVDVRGNKQLRFYALGALRMVLAAGEKVDTITLGIVQPNAPHVDGPSREETIDVIDLLDFEFELVAAARRASAPDAPRIAGDHCEYCKDAHACPALTAATAIIAADDFEPVHTIDVRKLSQLLDLGVMLEARMSAARALAQSLAEGGAEIPGYKLVERSSRRKWQNENEDANAHALAMRYGLSIDDLYARKLKSPTQVEKAIKKPRGKADEIKAAFNAEFVVRPPAGRTLVRDVDPRTALPAPNPAADFEVIDATPTQLF